MSLAVNGDWDSGGSRYRETIAFPGSWIIEVRRPFAYEPKHWVSPQRNGRISNFKINMTTDMRWWFPILIKYYDLYYKHSRVWARSTQRWLRCATSFSFWISASTGRHDFCTCRWLNCFFHPNASCNACCRNATRLPHLTDQRIKRLIDFALPLPD